MAKKRDEELPFVDGGVKTSGVRGRADIPERIIKKLARVAGLEYKDKHKRGGGGLCLGIDSGLARRKALMILGFMVSRIGKESSNVAVEGAGATWLDVLGWREDVEYAALWAASIRVRREVAASRLEDEIWERSTNGYDIEEPKRGAGGNIEMVTVRKFDNALGIQILKGLGFVGRDIGPHSAKPILKEGEKSAPGVDPEVEKAGPNIDTVLFADRQTAFDMMGEANRKDEG